MPIISATYSPKSRTEIWHSPSIRLTPGVAGGSNSESGRSDGTVAEVKVLEGFDDRLDVNARKALSAWHFVPGTRNGNPVDLEAVVRIPFRSKRSF